MNNDHWIISVLNDLQSFAEQNDQPRLVKMLIETTIVAKAEIDIKCQVNAQHTEIFTVVTGDCQMIGSSSDVI